MFLEQVLHPEIAAVQPVDAMAFLLFLEQAKEQAQYRRQGFLDIRDNDRLKLGPLPYVFQNIVELGQREHDLDVGVVNRYQHFVRRVGRVDRNDHAPGFKDAKIGDHELRRVRHEDPHPVTFFYTELHQRGCHTVRQRIHLLE